MVRNNKALEVQQRFNYCNLSQQTSLCCSRCEVPRAWSRTWLITREAYLLLLCSRSLWHAHTPRLLHVLPNVLPWHNSFIQQCCLPGVHLHSYGSHPISQSTQYYRWTIVLPLETQALSQKVPQHGVGFPRYFCFPCLFFFAQHYGWKMGGNTKTAVGSENFQKGSEQKD